MKQSSTEGDANCDSKLESLDEALKWCNESVESLPLLTHFQKGILGCLFSLLFNVDVQSLKLFLKNRNNYISLYL